MDEETAKKIIKKVRICETDMDELDAHNLLQRILERLYKLKLIKYIIKH